MKTFNIFATMFVATLALVSCDKEQTIDSITEPEITGERIIRVSFTAKSTKTELDGLQPKFKAGDIIMVSDGTHHESCVVKYEENTAFISIPSSISNEVTLTAVYPSGAWKASEPYYDVNSTQSGKFEDANICKAEIAAKANSAIFNNVTAVFAFDTQSLAEGAYIHIITVRPEIASNATEGNVKLNKVVVPASNISAIKSSSDKICYVSIIPDGLTAQELSFANGSKIKVPTSTGVLVPNNIYTVDMSSGWDYDYVEVDGLKWATRNVGATTPEETGGHYQWGSLTPDPRGGKPYPGSGPVYIPYQFNWTKAPFNNGQSDFDSEYFNSVKDDECPDGVLAIKNDVANHDWHGSWRIPRAEEFSSLINTTSTGNGNYSSYVLTINGTSLKFNSCGIGMNTEIDGGRLAYSSSSLSSSNQAQAVLLYIDSGNVTIGSYYIRSYGFSVRPVSD